ncbi:MAG: PqqD family protein [Actinomycetota bacterium]|nr:PqqD family protein [Actinomycetota bacterium]
MVARTEPRGMPLRRHGVRVDTSGSRPTLYDPVRDELHVLNDTALALWELCDGATTPQEMVDGICQLFTAVREMVEEDVSRALVDFTKAELIEWRPEPGGEGR